MNIKRLGLDLAKQVFQILGVDGQDKVVLRRAKCWITSIMPPCSISTEACTRAHYWAREL